MINRIFEIWEGEFTGFDNMTEDDPIGIAIEPYTYGKYYLMELVLCAEEQGFI